MREEISKLFSIEDEDAEDEVRVGASPVQGMTLRSVLRGHTDWIARIAWSRDGRFLASPSNDETIRIWDVERGECVAELEGHNSGVWGIAWSPDGSRLASGFADGTIRIWDVKTKKTMAEIKELKDTVFGVAWSPDGRSLASASIDGTINLFDTDKWKLENALKSENTGLSIAWSPDGDKIAACVYKNIHLFEVKSSDIKLLKRLEGHTGSVWNAIWSPDGGLLVSASGDNTIKLWNGQTGQPLRTLEGHTGNVHCLSFSSDSSLLASKGGDGVRLWRTDTWEPIAKLAETESGVWPPGIAFHPSQPILATLGEEDTAIRIWELDYEKLLGIPALSRSIKYTSAKIVLVGESNVGKSCLAMRLAEDRYPKEHEHGTTHGMRFWRMPPEKLSPTIAAPQGERREVILWDMGGQDEYRLVHQLFLHDTTLALVLLDPTRGQAEFDEVKEWNKGLEKQLEGRKSVKLLIGAKMDKPSKLIDSSGLNSLVSECGFFGYYETSALNGCGISELRKAIAEALDWDSLSMTARPELFQCIRDEIDSCCKAKDVVLYLSDLERRIQEQAPKLYEPGAARAVAEQLSAQGMIALTHLASGEPVLILKVEEIERYAGSLIVMARENQRGVPALEMRSVTSSNLDLPGIDKKDRLERHDELVVLECVVQLLIEHGVCFQHEGLLIFPTLFRPTEHDRGDVIPHVRSLFYDFSGAIDNIYASLISWMVIGKAFGRVRLWQDRAEFELPGTSTCGLRKVKRGGGFAHLDVYFQKETPENTREEFVSFVDGHLRQHGVEIVEHIAITCVCGYQFEEGAIHERIALGHEDIGCLRCDRRNKLVEGAEKSKEQNPELAQKMIALRTKTDEERKKIVDNVPKVFDRQAKSHVNDMIRILHLSDFQFTKDTSNKSKLQWLTDDIKKGQNLKFEQLDYLVVSGDFTNQGEDGGFDRAYEFVSELAQNFNLSAERCIFVPGNHDAQCKIEAFDLRDSVDGLSPDEWVEQGEIYLVRNAERYPQRFKRFSDALFHKFFQLPYPLDYADQGIAYLFPETHIQFLTLNSSWHIDQFNRKRSGIHPEAVAHVIKEADSQVKSAIEKKQLKKDDKILRFGVWHHAVAGTELMSNLDFIGHLQNNNVKICLHGDIHEMRREVIGYWHPKKMNIIASGSFGAKSEDRPESTPRLYNLLEIKRDFTSIRVHTRHQPKPDGAWKGWNEWPRPDGQDGALPYYDIKLNV